MAITVNILTPERKVLEVQADSVVVPSVQGELGILDNHAPLVAELAPGVIRLRKAEHVDTFSVSKGSIEVHKTDPLVETFAVSGGFVEVQQNRVTILAETAEMAHEIDLERARQAAERAKAALRSPQGTVDLAQAEAALRRALVRLHAAEAIRRRRP